MELLILGAGRQGRACAFDLLRTSGEEDRVVLADASEASLADAAAWLRSPRLATERADVADPATVASLAAAADVMVSCVPYRFNLELAHVAIAAGCHFVDLGGNTPLVLDELALDGKAREAGVTLIPDCGLGPGMINTIAVAAMEGFERVEEVRIYDGGLPQEPTGPLGYGLFFSVEGLVNEYFGPATALRGGRRVEVEGLSEVESLDLPPPLGRCEAAHAAGGLSTMAWTYEGRVGAMYNKLIRYPGHIALVHALRDMGFFGEETVEVGGTAVRPRDLSSKVLERHLEGRAGRDLVFIRVVVRGERGGRPHETVCEMLDLYDDTTGLTAMMRTTGFAAAIVARMLADGTISRRGAFPVEIAVPPGPFLEQAAERGFRFTWSRRDLAGREGA